MNVYTDELFCHWKVKHSRRTHTDDIRIVSTLLFADKQILIQETEEGLMPVAYFECPDYSFKISVTKIQMMAFSEKELISPKMEFNNCSGEQVQYFKYLGCDITYDYSNDIDNKINSFRLLCGTMLRNLKNKTHCDNKLKL